MNLPDSYSPGTIEPAVEDFWQRVDAYETAKEARSDDPTFYFLDGPPYVSGQTHLGNGWNKVLKDQMIRYLRMQGYDVTDRPGYDMHGLPIESKVEESLGFETKAEILDYGVEEFIDRCKEFSGEHKETLESDFKSLGVWMDWDNEYKTSSSEYIEAAWWSLQKMHENGLVDPLDRVINWCPRCGTALADAEVEYEQMSSPSVYVKFPVVDDEASMVIWTTTPWTLPANQYIAVDEDLTYARVRATAGDESEILIVAEACVDDVLRAARYDDFEVLETTSGAALEGTQYEHPLADEVPALAELGADDGVHQVYATEFVTAERTGLVHSAPGHGEEDYEFGVEQGLSTFSPVDDTGQLTEQAGAYEGLVVAQNDPDADANDAIVADLEEAGALLAEETEHHRYGTCWRCDSNIVNRATQQWFIGITDRKDQLLSEMDDSEWFPQWARDQRFRNWVEDARDWCFSRQRYWGIPIPIWVPENGPADDFIVVGSREELAERADQDVADADLHRPTVDEFTITEDGTTYRRIPDIFDVWFESGVASFASIGYPQDATAYEELWPADLVIEAHDQTRGWFWSQLEVGVATVGEVPYETVVMHGFLNDAESEKMSKSVGNIVEPKDARERHGVDATRLYLLRHTPQGQDFDFTWDGVANAERQLNVIWNTFRFADQYMTLDGVDPAELSTDDADLEPLDRWIRSRLNTLVESVTEEMEAFESHSALERIVEFLIDDVSRFYVQSIRSRVWADQDTASKRAAYATLSEVLLTCARLLSPFTPYVAEAIYQEFDGSEPTAHALSWPEPRTSAIDAELEADVATIRDVEEAGAKARQRAGRSLRWPVERVAVAGAPDALEAVERRASILAERLNARSVELVTEEFEAVTWRAEPEMQVLGPAFGDEASRVAEALRGTARTDLEDDGWTVAVDGDEYEIDEEMVTFERDLPEEISGTEFDGGWVYVDTELTPELEAEGFRSEIVRRTQELRKELDLELERRIRLAIDVDDERVADLVAGEHAAIAEEVRADEVVDELDGPAAETQDTIEGVTVSLAVEPVE